MNKADKYNTRPSLKQDEPLRLQKFLADNSHLSRRNAEEYIKQGRVSINDEITTEMGIKIDPRSDRIHIDGEIIKKRSNRKIYIAMNKPRGIICTKKDKHAEKIINDLLPKEYKHLHPVGRLDKESEGLILLTDDGEFTYRVTHPKFGCTKVYSVKIKGKWRQEEIKQAKKGVNIQGEIYKAKNIEQYLLGPSVSHLIITLNEGKNKHIRKMCEYFGHKVINLKRIAIGKLKLDALKAGSYKSFHPRNLDN